MKQFTFSSVPEFLSKTARPVINLDTLIPQVSEILQSVKSGGDTALKQLSEKFDKVYPDNIKVSETEITEAVNSIPDNLKQAIELARNNIEKFHQSQLIANTVITETAQGVYCWQKSVPVEKIGIYIPGGSAPLFSTVLMLGVPANLAGCSEIVLCTPMQKNAKVSAEVLYCAHILGISQIFKIGGAQAIAAMAYGTESVPQVYKIFGPGNQYVTIAKQLVSTSGTAIDMPAGPSELAIIADDTAIPAFVAADLLSQAEHGEDSQVLLLTSSEKLAKAVLSEIDSQLNLLPRKAVAEKAFEHSCICIVNSVSEAITLSNLWAPEHLIIATANATQLARQVTNAGSVFIGNWATESAGDYASGTNHTLPTNGAAKAYSGLTLDSFMKKITFQEITQNGIQTIGPAIELMAQAEQLQAHSNAVTVRLQYLNNNNKE